MRRKILCLILILIGFFQSFSAQSADDKDRAARANEILNLARRAVYQNIKKEDIKSLYLALNGTTAMESVMQIDGSKEPRETKIRQVAETSVSVELPGKIRQEVYGYTAEKNPAENYTKVRTILDGERFSTASDTVIDGKAFDMKEILNAPYLPETVKKQMKEAMEKAKPTKEMIQNGASNVLFTILLSPLWGDDKTFVYVGKAEAGDGGGRADVLEIESNTGRQSRWFFDEKTHLLLMITDEISKNGIDAKTTQYFSDYQLIEGLLIAKKINAETESVSNMPEMEIMGRKMKMSGKSKSVTETIVKEFKINPTFKAETFAVKEEKK